MATAARPSATITFRVSSEKNIDQSKQPRYGNATNSSASGTINLCVSGGNVFSGKVKLPRENRSPEQIVVPNKSAVATMPKIVFTESVNPGGQPSMTGLNCVPSSRSIANVIAPDPIA